MKLIVRILLVVAILTALVSAVQAQTPAIPEFKADQLTIHAWQESIDFSPVRIDSTLYVAEDDPGLVRLLALNGTSLDWSADRTALFLKLTHGDVHWDVTENKGTIGTAEVTLPGAVVAKDGKLWLSAAAVVQFLGLTLAPLDEASGSYVLLPVLASVAVQSDATGTRWVFSGNGRLSVETAPDDQGLVLVFPQTACQLPDDATVGDAHVVVQCRGNAWLPTRILMTFPTHWKGVLGSRLLLDQVVVHRVPDYAVANVDMAPAPLTSMAMESSSPEQAVYRLDATGPFAWAWQWDGQGSLRLLLMHAAPVVPPPPTVDTGNALLTRVETTVVSTDPYPVVQVVFTLAPGAGFKLEKAGQGDVKSLRLTVAPGAVAATEGSDTWRPSLHGLIVLDPGHGGGDPGCHDRWTGVCEKDVTLDICLKLKTLLEARGLGVILTREDDRDVTYAGSPDAEELAARANVANNNGADIFVSVHCNASVSSAPRGTEIHWYKDEDYGLAQSVRDSLESASLGPPMNGCIRSRFYVLRHTDVPSILVETAYLTNPEEGAWLSSDGFRTRMAQALANALSQYMGQVAVRPREPMHAAPGLH